MTTADLAARPQARELSPGWSVARCGLETGPSIYPYLKPSDIILHGQIDFADITEDHSAGRTPRLVWVAPARRHTYPCKRETGEVSQRHTDEGATWS